MENFSCFKRKDVINICDGTRLGNVTDIVFDEKSGGICRLIISGEPCCFGFFGKSDKTEISWDSIVKISEDIVLVSVDKFR